MAKGLGPKGVMGLWPGLMSSLPVYILGLRHPFFLVEYPILFENLGGVNGLRARIYADISET